MLILSACRVSATVENFYMPAEPMQRVGCFASPVINPARQRQIVDFPLLALDRHRAEPIGAQQHTPRPLYMLLRAVPRSDHDDFQSFAVARAKPDFNAFFIRCQRRSGVSDSRPNSTLGPSGSPQLF
jgi:hypothetical protein